LNTSFRPQGPSKAGIFKRAGHFEKRIDSKIVQFSMSVLAGPFLNTQAHILCKRGAGVWNYLQSSAFTVKKDE